MVSLIGIKNLLISTSNITLNGNSVGLSENKQNTVGEENHGLQDFMCMD